MYTVLVFVALVLLGAVTGALFATAMTTFEPRPRSLRTPPAGGRHRAKP